MHSLQSLVVVSCPMLGAKLAKAHSHSFDLMISPGYLTTPSPSLETMNTTGRSSVASFKLRITSAELTT